jgi:hypothetical protein
MLRQSEKRIQTTQNRFWKKFRISCTKHFTLETISSDEDLVEMDDEEIQFERIKLF